MDNPIPPETTGGTSGAKPGPKSGPVTTGRQIAIACVVACAFVMQGVDMTLLTIAIPTIAPDLGVSPLVMHFAITAYLLSLAVFMPVSGWFADRFGARRVFCGAVCIFVLGAVLAGLSPTLGLMVPARFLQGFGGALMTPVGRLILLRAFGKGRTLDAMMWLTIPVLIGPLVGPLLGAVIVQHFDWRLIFFVSLPICAMTLILARWLMPPDTDERKRTGFDWGGFAMAGAALTLFQLGVEHLGHPLIGGEITTVALFAAAFVTFRIYRRHAARHPAPALDLRLFRLRAFRVGVIAGGIGRVGVNSLAFLLPLVFQVGMGMTPIEAGLIAATAALGAFAAKPFLKRMVARWGYGPTITGVVALSAVLIAGFAFLSEGMSAWLIVPYVIVAGSARTVYFNTVNALTYSDVPPEELSRSVATAGVFQQLSMGLGISLSAALLALVAGEGHVLEMSDFATVFLMMAAIPLIALPVFARLRPERPESSQKPPARRSAQGNDAESARA